MRSMMGARAKLIAGGALAAVLVYAWIDGGEEPLRPISEPVAMPVTAR
ncbi:hypothetical protein [Tsuneonella sp. SYSU-LHT278]